MTENETTVGEVIDAGLCAGGCMVSDPDGDCDCRCGGAYHGVLRTHGVEVVDLDPVTNRYECYVCRRRLWWAERIFVAEDLTPLCLNCATGARTVEAHADVYYHCDKPWHDMYDHPSMTCETSDLHRLRMRESAELQAVAQSTVIPGPILDAHQFNDTMTVYRTFDSGVPDGTSITNHERTTR